MVLSADELPLYDRLTNKIITFYSTIWKDKRDDGIHELWLQNFTNSSDDIEYQQKLNALYLLSKFMYFGNLELRELLKCIYRDLFKYHIISEIRKKHSNITDCNFLESNFKDELNRTRFLGMGNPSESGVHLLYYFRQENKLQKDLFINTHEIFKYSYSKKCVLKRKPRNILKTNLRNKLVKRYIFIDDFCGSGTQAKDYSKDIVDQIKNINPDIQVDYLMLFATAHGKQTVENDTSFNRVETIFTIDETFKCFSDNSRYYLNKNFGEDEDSTLIEKDFSKNMCNTYGNKLYPVHPCGYKDGQLLLGLFHNTPDNTLPIFWSDLNKWTPIFKRYDKIY